MEYRPKKQRLDGRQIHRHLIQSGHQISYTNHQTAHQWLFVPVTNSVAPTRIASPLPAIVDNSKLSFPSSVTYRTYATGNLT